VSGISVVVPNRNGAGVIERCLDALAGAAGVEEIIVVDDGSTDGSPDAAASRGARVLRSPGRGFSAAANHGMAAAAGRHVLLLNSDAFVRPDTVVLLAEALDTDRRLAACAAGLEREDGSRAKSFGRLITLGYALRLALSMPPGAPVEEGLLQDAEFVPLACVAVRREAWDAVGGLDEGYAFYFEDYDLCWRLGEGGWRIAVRWDARAVHLEGASSSARDPQAWFPRFHRSRLRYLRKRYPRGFLLYLAVWVPSALAHGGLWLLRSPRAEGRAWARAYLRSIL
jgi:N-acetylglucosaminyl-diphospho-decaprenol L-rhamnosyltransferase